MLPEVSVDVELQGGEATFRFTPPVSILVLMVSDAHDELAWQLTAGDVQAVPAGEGTFTATFTAVPIAEAPPELLEMLRQAEANFMNRIRERGPTKPPIALIRYGVVPPGCTQEVLARKLSPGEYEVSVVAEQGQGAARFSVPAA